MTGTKSHTSKKTFIKVKSKLSWLARIFTRSTKEKSTLFLPEDISKLKKNSEA